MLEPTETQYVTIGHIAQSHGVEGMVLVIPEVDDPDIFDDLRLVRLQNHRGDLVPARIESVRVQQKNNRLSFFVKFDHITDRNGADTLKNFSVCVDRDKISATAVSPDEPSLMDYAVYDEDDQKMGHVQDILENSAQHILVVQTENKDLLIPMVDKYIVAIDDEAQTITGRELHQLAKL